jgi:hypothetical protein
MRKTRHKPKPTFVSVIRDEVLAAAKILTEHGYGMDKDTLAQELSKISNLPKFLYTFARCAEKDSEALHRAREATRT